MAKAPAWTSAEVDILRTVYADQGLKAAAAQLPGRSRGSIYVKANTLGIHSTHHPCPEGKFRKLVDPAMSLRAAGWSYAAIAIELGVSEGTATNACLLGEGMAKGHRPIERDANHKIAPAGIERMRLMLRKGMKHRDMQIILGVGAATVTRERRAYEHYLRDNRLAPLPPPGGGERYSGVAVPKSVSKQVERLYLDGWGSATISARTGVSRTHVLRMRRKLIARLKRSGRMLTGCDAKGRRIAFNKDHPRRIPDASLDELRRLILDGEPVARAARLAIVGACTAYRIYHELKAELEANGKATPPRKPWRGNKRPASAKIEAPALPGKRSGVDRYRALVHGGTAHRLAVVEVRNEYAARNGAATARRLPPVIGASEAFDGKRWCDQCQRSVICAIAAACRDRFCTLQRVGREVAA